MILHIVLCAAGALFFIHPIYPSLHLQIPNSQSSPPLPSFTLDNHKSVVYVSV